MRKRNGFIRSILVLGLFLGTMTAGAVHAAPDPLELSITSAGDGMGAQSGGDGGIIDPEPGPIYQGNLTFEQQRAVYMGVLAANACYADVLPQKLIVSPKELKIKGMENIDKMQLTHEPDASAAELRHHSFNLTYLHGDRDFGALLAERDAMEKDAQGNAHHVVTGIIAIRGTCEAWSWVMNNAASACSSRLFQYDLKDPSCFVPWGFDNYTDQAFLTVNDQSVPSIVEFARRINQNPDGKLLITGHSLGGSSLLVAMKLLEAGVISIDKLQVATFGQPLMASPGMIQYAKDTLKLTDDNYLRVVRINEIVTAVPPKWLGFDHFGKKICSGSGSDWAEAHYCDYYVDDLKQAPYTRDFLKVWYAEDGRAQ